MADDAIEVSWEEPPEPRTGRGYRWWDEVITLVAQRPGYWACIRRYETKPRQAGNGASVVKRAYKNGQLPPGTWEIRSVTDNGVGKIYVRYTQ